MYRNWFSYVRYSDYIKNFKIDKTVSDLLEKDMTSQKLNPDEMDIILRLSKFYAISKGRDHLLFDDYQHIRELEKERKSR